MDIVRLQDGDSRASAYCLPIATGAINPYFELAKAIGPGHLVYGIQFADRVQTGKFKEFSSLREMAIAMLPEFLAHHRDGPICLIGYSFAASLAIELAQQLIGLGKSIPLVVIIDREPPSDSLTSILRMKHFIRNVGPWAIKVATRAITDTNYRSLYYNKVVHNYNKLVHRAPWYKDLPEDHQDYTKKNLAASRNYRFQGVYRNKILLFRRDHGAHPLRCIQGKDYGWGRITGARVDVVYVPGEHLSMMENPNVVHIANALRLALSACQLSP
jgi:thioesterase domain-containing protein